MMSLQHSPKRLLTSSGSQPDLSKMNTLNIDPQITLRKRKQPSDRECGCSNEITEIKSELTRMSSLLEQYVGSNQHMLTKMQESITEVKTQISEMKSSNEQTINLIRENVTEVKTQVNEIKKSTTGIVKEQMDFKTDLTRLEKLVSLGENKLNSLESSFKTLNVTSQTTASTVEHQLRSSEQLIREVQERHNREKNIIVVGLPEQTSSNVEERTAKDEADVLKITSIISNEIPKPIKIFRIGKFNPERNRSIKACYESHGPAKQLLRNKAKLPEYIKIFSDQTPSQQKYLKSLQDELKCREKNGESGLTIKYINGTPTIINPIPKNSKQ